MPLSMVNAGEPFTIKIPVAKKKLSRHLEELGFVVEEELSQLFLRLTEA